MTCVAAIVSNNTVYMGGDSLASNEITKTVRKEPKVFDNGEFLIGACGSFRMSNILRWKFNPPTLKNGDDLHRFMCVDFVDSLRESFKESGYAITENDWESGWLLVGIRGRLFEIQEDFQVAEHEKIAIGSGCYHALGCLYALSDSDLSPKKQIIKSLKCAENFVMSVQGPFVVLKNKAK